MHTVRDLVTLASKETYSAREIAHTLGISHQSVLRYLSKISDKGYTPSEALSLCDDDLEALTSGEKPGPMSDDHEPVDLAWIDKELSHTPAPTKQLLWEEYVAAAKIRPYSYSQFSAIVRDHRKRSLVSMHLDHLPGDRLFLDYAGETVPLYDPAVPDAVVAKVPIFVATLAYSGYTVALPVPAMDLVSTLWAIEEAVRMIGGVPGRLVPDNMATAVLTAKATSPKRSLRLHPGFSELCAHLGTVADPTRVGHPKDKAKVEAMVGVTQRDILRRLRHVGIYEIEDLGDRMRNQMDCINARPMAHGAPSRLSVFAQSERATLGPLPKERFAFGTWSSPRVRPDYHVYAHKSYYSVPYALVGMGVRVKVSAKTVEIYDRSSPVAVHQRSMVAGSFTTNNAHRPPHHQAWAASNSLEGAQSQIARIGPAGVAYGEAILTFMGNPGIAMASLVALGKLPSEYGTDAVERACADALGIGTHSIRSLRAILSSGGVSDEGPPTVPTPQHANLRGAASYGGSHVS